MKRNEWAKGKNLSASLRKQMRLESLPRREFGSSEQVKVYWGGHRRYFNLNHAAVAEARKRIKKHCRCEEGNPCNLHSDFERYEYLVERLSQRLLRNL